MKKRRKIKVSIKKNPTLDPLTQDCIEWLKRQTIESLTSQISDYLYPTDLPKYNGEKYNRAVNVDCNGKPLETK